ncbi:hypothetical protein ACMU_04135 [Actibacterium mucosum KCTC 23349]|uniref:Uncharacterized protein n=1 Tax=Actibacterium mucosum KCTC 23349 TaxID=1454373 RepID=A0A037ZD62_9RHOB|nr:hypothetical protein ACMU_04135 [Actibacterium mucosum KCTC 23349]
MVKPIPDLFGRLSDRSRDSAISKAACSDKMNIEQEYTHRQTYEAEHNDNGTLHKMCIAILNIND